MRTPTVLCLVLLGCAPSADDAPSEDTDATPEQPTDPDPRLERVELGPDGAHHGVVLGCQATAAGTTDRVAYAWSVDGADLPEATTPSLDLDTLERGDEVVCTATPWDGDVAGEPLSDALTIANSPPTTPEIRILPEEPDDLGSVLCKVTTEAMDHEDDPITYTFTWTEPTRGITRVDEDPEDDQSVLTGNEIEAGDVWTCTVVAHDGFDPSTPATAQVEVTCSTLVYYLDRDGDGYGDTSQPATACNGSPPPDHVWHDGDCDDTPGNGAAFRPGADEVIGEGVDYSCDGLVRCYADLDGDDHVGLLSDTFPVTVGGSLSCDTPNTSSTAGDDCDDRDPQVHPGAPERCNGVDDDCDGTTPDRGFTGLSTATVPSTSADDLQIVLDAGATIVQACEGAEVSGVVVESDVQLVGTPGTRPTLHGTGDTSMLTVTGGGQLTLRDLRLVGGGGTDGGALRVEPGSSALLENITLELHEVVGVGGAIHAEGTSDEPASLTFAGTVLLASNRASFGGAIGVEGRVDVSLGQALVDGNTATLDGGAVWASGAVDLSARDTVWSSNTAHRTGGAARLEGANLVATFSGLELEGQRALEGDGGAISVSQGELTWNDGAIVDGEALLGHGGALHCDGCRLITGTGNQTLGIFRGNRALRGGAVAAEGSACVLLVGDAQSLQGRIEDHEASESGGAIHLAPSASVSADDVVIAPGGGTSTNTASGVVEDLAASPNGPSATADASGMLTGRWWWDGAAWQVDPVPAACPP